VLGGGHRQFFPKRNAALAERMVAAGGAVLSPFEPDHPAMPHQFLQRNAVVAALSDAIVVVEAPARSGALNTAGWAAGRIPVFAVPGDVDRKHSAGCLALIRDGATLARNGGDVLEALQIAPSLFPEAAQTAGADALETSLLERLRAGEASLDELVVAADAAPSRVLAALSMLEIRGAIEPRSGNRYGIRR
jgi:DNA processing protein